MSPIFNTSLLAQPYENQTRFSASTNELGMQWAHPADVMSVLLLLGGEIVNKALAQLAGGTITPVAFSFGVPTTLDITCFGLHKLIQHYSRLGLIRRYYAPRQCGGRKANAIDSGRALLGCHCEEWLYPQ
jgi:hypothetical protein